MARGIILLLLLIHLAVATALSSPSTRIEGSFVGERSNSFSSSVAALAPDSGSSSAEHKLQQGEKAFKPEAYAVTWSPSDQQSHDDIVAHQSSFEPEAYPVRWKKPDQQLQGEVAAHQSAFTPKAYAVTWGPPDQQSHSNVAVRQNSFAPEAYPVKWKQSNQQLQGDVAAHHSSFMPEAYAVTWGPPDQQSHSNVAARQNSFAPEAYPVKWKQSNQQLQGDVATHHSSFMPEAYAMTWGPPDQQSHGNVAARQNSFAPEAYPVKWKQSIQQLQGDVVAHHSSFTPEAYAVTWDLPNQQSHGDVAARQNSFEPEAYPVKWKKPDQQLQGDDVAAHQSSFTPEAYAVNWGPPDQQSHGVVAARQNSFEPEAYRVIWKQLVQAPDAAEPTPARGHGLHVEPGMLFTRKSLLPGTVLPEGTKFGGEDGFPDPQRFVLRADADAIPFSYSQLDTILRMFQIPRGSKKAEQVAATLRTCEADESPDPHTCATSEQAAADFAAASLGVRASELVAVVTVVHGRKDAARYVVAPDGIARIGKAAGGPAVAAAVPCHPMAYPYMVHYCHRPVDVEALRVELTGLGDSEATTTAIAMCHTNTTSWDARYFEMLNATRGEEICHFMPRNYVLWLPAADL